MKSSNTCYILCLNRKVNRLLGNRVWIFNAKNIIKMVKWTVTTYKSNNGVQNNCSINIMRGRDNGVVEACVSGSSMVC